MGLDPKIPYGDVTYDIIGAAMRVHSRLGPGLKEIHYQRALAAEVRTGGRTADEEHFIELWDGDVWLGRLYLDALVSSVVDAECKSHPHMLTDEEVAQVICYLAATGLKVGLLLNFGRKRLEYRRVLAPRILEGWQTKVVRFLWRPDHAGPVPEIVSPANIRVVKPDKPSAPDTASPSVKPTASLS
ncbi:MAG: GxxExxY protein [Chloroflexi bacterium]|nr:GxxExxY protein [Chloroflexota bacterium]